MSKQEKENGQQAGDQQAREQAEAQAGEVWHCVGTKNLPDTKLREFKAAICLDHSGKLAFLGEIADFLACAFMALHGMIDMLIQQGMIDPGTKDKLQEVADTIRLGIDDLNAKGPH